MTQTIAKKRLTFLEDLAQYENAITKDNFHKNMSMKKEDDEIDHIDIKERNFDLFEETPSQNKNEEFDLKNDSIKNLNELEGENVNELAESVLKSKEFSKANSVELRNQINENNDMKLKNSDINVISTKKPYHLNFSMDWDHRKQKGKHKKTNLSTQSARLYPNSFLKESKHDLNEINDNPPRFVRVLVKIKDNEIQTDDEPLILPEHLRFEGEENNPDFFQSASKKNRFSDLKEEEIRKIEKLQKFYLERYRQKKNFEKEKRAFRYECIKKIQKFFRMCLNRIHFKVCLDSNKDKLLVKKNIIKRPAPSTSFFDNYLYFMRVFLIKSLKSLDWMLYDFLNKKIYEVFTDVSPLIDQDEEIYGKENLNRIMDYINKMSEYIEINNGFIEFTKKIATLDDSLELDKEIDKDSRKLIDDSPENNKIIIFDRNNTQKIIALQRKFKQIFLKKEMQKNKAKNTHIFFIKTKKIAYNAYVRICYCSTSQPSYYEYVTGAILSDITYKLNIIVLEEKLLQCFEKKITPENIFDMVNSHLFLINLHFNRFLLICNKK